jgi:hypothetical protein
VARAVDGREFGVWDRNLAEALGAHLHEDLLCEVTSKQDNNGNWWNNLQGLPALGIQQAPRQQQQASSAPGAPVDLQPLTTAVERIALTLDNLLAFATDVYLTGKSVDLPGPEDDGPVEP